MVGSSSTFCSCLLVVGVFLLDKNRLGVVGYTLGGLTATLNEEEYDVPATVEDSGNKYNQAPTPHRYDSVGSEMGEPQVIDIEHHNEVFDKISEARLYMKDYILLDDLYEPVRDICKNRHEQCAFWAMLGECEANPTYMKINCGPVCKSCDQLLQGGTLKKEEYDVPASVEGFGNSGSHEFDSVGSEMGEPQIIEGTLNHQIFKKIAEARTYMKDVMSDDFYEPVRDICKNKHESCAFWAAAGECEANPGYMKINCAPICKTCEQVKLETRCPLDPNAIDAWYPGDVNRMFERITTDPQFQQYEPKTHSRPDYAEGDTEETADYIIGPWLITLENALTDEEADRLIALGGIIGYERSSDVGKKLPDGTYDQNINNGRTSTNAWCVGECYEDDLAKTVMDRIENITGIPETNSENLQLLRYEEGQFYQAHNDYIEHQLERQTGVRILTFYLYLNEVEEGGQTRFPQLDIDVTPKRGRAALWPSVLNESPNMRDSRTEHQAMPVIKGVKYGANAWLHQRDFKTPNLNAC